MHIGVVTNHGGFATLTQAWARGARALTQADQEG